MATENKVNRMKDVTISPAINGWVIKIGCLTAVAISKEGMLSEISRYIDDPNGVEVEYAANALNQGTYTPDGREEVPPPAEPATQPAEEGDCNSAPEEA